MPRIEQSDAYPLTWPAGFPRWPMHRREEGAFRVTPGDALNMLLHEVSLLGGARLLVSTNVPLRRDGLPYANRRAPDDTGVAIYFDIKGTQHAMACDRYDRVWKNIRALALCIGALRSLGRHGASAILDRAFAGFKALPDGIVPAAPWWTTLGLDAEPVVYSAGDVDRWYRARAIECHPDKGGSDVEMAQLNEARGRALRGPGRR